MQMVFQLFQKFTELPIVRIILHDFIIWPVSRVAMTSWTAGRRWSDDHDRFEGAAGSKPCLLSGTMSSISRGYKVSWWAGSFYFL